MANRAGTGHHLRMADNTSPPDYAAKHPGLLFERHPNGVLLITLNRPEVFNATDAPLHYSLSRVWDDIHDDDDTRVVVVTGAGEAFSAGGDLEWIEGMAGDYSVIRNVLKEAGDIVYKMMSCEKIIISAINGVAVGAGLAVALMADISIIDEEAKFTDGHLRLGVGAGDHANILWPLACGMAKAKYYLLTADFIDGKTADEIGLVSKSVPGDQLMDEAMKVANKIATGPQDAARWTKRSLNLWLQQAAPAFDASLAFEMLSFLGPDAAEGARALREKRKADFQ
ncbi:MAG: enoyl-CoA hydratase [Acidimicrobiales bacterium]